MLGTVTVPPGPKVKYHPAIAPLLTKSREITSAHIQRFLPLERRGCSVAAALSKLCPFAFALVIAWAGLWFPFDLAGRDAG